MRVAFPDYNLIGRIYKGVGQLTVKTLRGELKACSGDLIIELGPEDNVVLHPSAALAIFGHDLFVALPENLASFLAEVLEPTFELPQGVSLSDVPDVEQPDGLTRSTSSLGAEENSQSLTLSNAPPDAGEGSKSQTDESTKSSSETSPEVKSELEADEKAAADLKAAFEKK